MFVEMHKYYSKANLSYWDSKQTIDCAIVAYKPWKCSQQQRNRILSKQSNLAVDLQLQARIIGWPKSAIYLDWDDSFEYYT